MQNEPKLYPYVITMMVMMMTRTNNSEFRALLLINIRGKVRVDACANT